MKLNIQHIQVTDVNIISVSIPLYISITQFVGFFKGKSSLMIFARHVNLKCKYGSRYFWCIGYYADTIDLFTSGKN